MDFPEHDPDVVFAMLEYIYNGKYGYGKTSPELHDYVRRATFDVEVYAIGAMYQARKLRDEALSRFTSNLAEGLADSDFGPHGHERLLEIFDRITSGLVDPRKELALAMTKTIQRGLSGDANYIRKPAMRKLVIGAPDLMADILCRFSRLTQSSLAGYNCRGCRRNVSFRTQQFWTSAFCPKCGHEGSMAEWNEHENDDDMDEVSDTEEDTDQEESLQRSSSRSPEL